MRTALALAAFLVASPAMAAPFTKEECSALARASEQSAEGLGEFLSNMERLRHLDYKGRATGGLADASERLNAARATALPAMREFVSAMSELANQARACARRWPKD